MLASTGFPLPEFHAPPPSPEGAERWLDGAAEDDELQGFLDRGNAVPKLALPDRIFPRQIHPTDPPEIDFRSLGATSSCLEDLRSAARRIGCFQLVNHGIPREVIWAAGAAAAGVFRLGPEEKAGLVAASAKRCGFEGEGREEGDDEELFWWRRGGEDGQQASEKKMAGIWPEGYNDFSYKMGHLQREIGKIASKIEQILFSEDKLDGFQNSKLVTRTGAERVESTLHINKCKQGQEHCSIVGDFLPNALQHDAVRLFIRSCEHPHALCIHVTRCSRFQVFSKKGWISFKPNDEALVVTIGNQTQDSRGSLYKHVMGKPFLGAKDEVSISIAVLYSCPTMEKVCNTVVDDEKVISLAQQAILAVFLTFLYHVIVYLCGNM